MAGHCIKHGLEHYLPLREETKIYQRRKVTVHKPVFVGYIFVALDRTGRLALLKTNHILRIIEPENERLLLHQLAQIREALAVDPTLGACAALVRGRRVRISGGPFMGVEGVVWTFKKDRSKVRLNVEMIGQAVAIEVDKDYLEMLD